MTDQATKPRRSALYMPGSNPRALEKGRALPADVLILDLEDGVLPEKKEEARARVAETIGNGGYGRRELVVRVNGADTDWFEPDLKAVATCGANAVLLPKVDGPETVRRADSVLTAAGAAPDLGIWCMLETPMGILNARETATASERLQVLTLGTADLSKELRANLHAPGRLPLMTSIGLAILAARAYGLTILDAPHFDLSDDDGFAESCRQGRDLGFDGKCLLHPKTIDVANAVFGPSEPELGWARRIIAAHAEAAREGKGVTLVDGKLIEGLHVAEAEQLLSKAAAIAALEDS